MMATGRFSLASLRQELIDNNLHVKAIIQVCTRSYSAVIDFQFESFPFQDIVSFRGSIAELEVLNESGRSKISALRKCIEGLDDYARDEADAELAKEVDNHRQQFSRYV